MKLTRHNGRAGKNGAYNPKHNDRSFNISNSEHIDEEKAKQREYAAKRLDGVITKIKNTMQTAVQKIQTSLLQPEIKKSGTEQIKSKARASVLDKLNRKIEAIRQDSQHRFVERK